MGAGDAGEEGGRRSHLSGDRWRWQWPVQRRRVVRVAGCERAWSLCDVRGAYLDFCRRPQEDPPIMLYVDPSCFVFRGIGSLFLRRVTRHGGRARRPARHAAAPRPTCRSPGW
eukprot:5206950-Prymnesium_polylepis.1